MISSALVLTLTVSLTATLVVALLGTLAGHWLARSRFPGREWVDAVMMLPLVLPPTVTGYYLLVLLGRRGAFGAPLFAMTGQSITFSWVACVIAASVMAFPLMVRAARFAFESVDPRHELAAASLGHRPRTVFLRVTLPLARRGLVAGIILAFARAVGEFGATLMLAGNIRGRTQTLPLAIYEAVITGEDRIAAALSILLTVLSLAVIISATRLGGRLR